MHLYAEIYVDGLGYQSEYTIRSHLDHNLGSATPMFQCGYQKDLLQVRDDEWHNEQ